MGAVLSKLELSRFELKNLIKIWMKSSYFRVAIAMIIFLMTRRMYNKCHRLYYNLPLNGPTGLPLIGCIPYLLVNTYKFMQNMSQYGDIASFNSGLQTVCCINNMQIARKIVEQQQEEKKQDAAHDACVESVAIMHHNEYDAHQLNDMIEQQLNEEFLTKCIKSYILRAFYPNKADEICLRKDLKCVILNTMMSACFGVTLDATQIDETLYEKWDNAREKYIKKQSLSSLAFDGALFGMIISKLFSGRRADKEEDYYEIWRDIFCEHIKPNIENDINSQHDINTECIWYQMQMREEASSEMNEMSDLFTITAHSMDSTASSLEWSIISLCKFSALQAKIYEEIYEACAGNLENIALQNDYESKCTVLKSFIFDILRLHPFGSLPRFRCNSSKKAIVIELSDGTSVRVAPYGLYHINLYGMKHRDFDEIHLDTNDEELINGFVPKNAVEKAFKIKALTLIISLLLFTYKFEFKHAEHEKDEINVILITKREQEKVENDEEDREKDENEAGNEENYGEMEENMAPQKGIKINTNQEKEVALAADNKVTKGGKDPNVIEIEPIPESVHQLTVENLKRHQIRNRDRNKTVERFSDEQETKKQATKTMTITNLTPSGMTTRVTTRVPTRRLCTFYGSAAGCSNGDICYWSHLDPNSVALCRMYDMQTKQGCKHGNRCKFRHEVHMQHMDQRSNQFKARFKGTKSELEAAKEALAQTLAKCKMKVNPNTDHLTIIADDI